MDVLVREVRTLSLWLVRVNGSEEGSERIPQLPSRHRREGGGRDRLGMAGRKDQRPAVCWETRVQEVSLYKCIFLILDSLMYTVANSELQLCNVFEESFFFSVLGCDYFTGWQILQILQSSPAYSAIIVYSKYLKVVKRIIVSNYYNNVIIFILRSLPPGRVYRSR